MGDLLWLLYLYAWLWLTPPRLFGTVVVAVLLTSAIAYRVESAREA